MKISYPKLHSIRMKNHDNVEWLGNVTSLNIDPQTVLLGALNERMTEAVVVGFDKEGNFYFASSLASTGDVLYHLEQAKHELFKMQDRLTGDIRYD